MRTRVLLIAGATLLLASAYWMENRTATIAHAEALSQGVVPKSYGRLVTAIPDSIGTGLVFEDKEGVIRFVSITGMKEGELARYDQTPTQGGIPRSYGHLVTAVVNSAGTALVFEDPDGVIRFVTITGKKEGELTRD
jgi:hypothetical protein